MVINNSGYQITENHGDNNECRGDDTISLSVGSNKNTNPGIKTPADVTVITLWFE